MTHEQPTLHHLSAASSSPDEFVVYHWTNPKVTYEYSYLATNADRSVLLSLGQNNLSFDFELPPETERWLTQDYAPNGERFHLDMTAVSSLIKRAHPGGAIFGFAHFAKDLTLYGIEMSIQEPVIAQWGPEYVILSPGNYKRWYRSEKLYVPLSPEEHAMIDGCCAIFRPLAESCGHLLRSPTTPKYQPKAERVME